MRRTFRASLVCAMLVVVVGGGSAHAATSGSWRRVTPMNAGRGWFGAAVANGLLFAVGGDGRGSIEAYKASTQTWRYHAALPDARDWFAVTEAGGDIYAFGGLVHGARSTHSSRESDRYDPWSDSWTRVAAMPTDRYAAAAVTGLDGKIYVIGGWSTRSNTALTTLEVYDPSANAWHVRASMRTPRQSLGAAIDGRGRIYAIGGYNSAHGYLRTVERYNPAKNRWGWMPPMHEARAGLCAVTASNGRIYAMGGYNPAFRSFPFRRTTEVYSAFAHVWRPAPPMPVARANFAVARLGPKLYAMGGQNRAGSRLRSVDAFRPVLHK